MASLSAGFVTRSRQWWPRVDAVSSLPAVLAASRACHDCFMRMKEARKLSSSCRQQAMFVFFVRTA
jgi:hypothetical protein